MKIFRREHFLVWGYAVLLFPLVIILFQMTRASRPLQLADVWAVIPFILFQIIASFLSFAIVFFVYTLVVYGIRKYRPSLDDRTMLMIGFLVGNVLLIIYEPVVLGTFFAYDTFNGVRFTVVRCVAFSLALCWVYAVHRKPVMAD